MATESSSSSAFFSFTAIPSASPSPLISISGGGSESPISSATATATASATASATGSATASATSSATASATSSATSSASATATATSSLYTTSPTPSAITCGCGQGTIPVPASLLPYGIVAASAIAGGTAVVNGGMAISPSGLSSITFFPPSTYTGVVNAGNGVAASAQTALTALTLALQSAPSSGIPSVSQLGSTYGTPLLASTGPQTTYKAFTDLYLDGSLTLTGGICDQFYFLVVEDIFVSNVAPFTLTLLGGLQASNVFWVTEIGSIHVNDNSLAAGVFIARSSITFTGSAVLDGSAFASTGSVTLDATTINNQCFVNPARRVLRRSLFTLPTPKGLRQAHTGKGEPTFRCPPGFHWLALDHSMGVCEEEEEEGGGEEEVGGGGEHGHGAHHTQQQVQHRGLQGMGGCPIEFLDPATGICFITDVTCSQPGGVYNPLTAQCNLPANIPWVATTQTLLLTATTPTTPAALLPPPLNLYISAAAARDGGDVTPLGGVWSVSGVCELSGSVSTSPQAILTSLSTAFASLSSLQGLGLTLQFSPSVTHSCAFTVTSNSTLALSQVCVLLAASDFATAAAATTPTQLSTSDLTALFTFVGLSTSDAGVLGVTLLGAMESSGSGVTGLSLSPVVPNSAVPPLTPPASSTTTTTTDSSSSLASGPIVGIVLASILMAILLAVLTLRLRKQWSSPSSSSSSSNRNSRSSASASLFSQRPPTSVNPEGRGGATAEVMLSPTNATAAGSSGTLRRRGGVGASGSSGGAKGVEVHDN
jgi:hypothetical protein